MVIMVAAEDRTVMEKVTYILREKEKGGNVRIAQCGSAPQLCGLLQKQPPEILIVFPEKVTKAVLNGLGLIDPEKTAVVAVIPDLAGEMLIRIQQYPVRWYLPEQHLEKHLCRMIEESEKKLKNEREVRQYRITHLYKIGKEFKRIILAEFDTDPGMLEYQRFIRFFSRSGFHSCVVVLPSGAWAVCCTDGEEREARRHILFMLRYFENTGRRMRFAVSERITEADGAIKKIRQLSAILAAAEGETEKRILFERDFKAMLRDNVRAAVYTACRYVEKNYARRLKICEIADQCFISPNYLSEIFRKDMGIHLSAYIEQVRMGHAVRMLAEEGKLIKDVALICGFHSISYFSKRFKAIHGISPKKYREKEKRERSRKVSSVRVIL